MGNIFKLLGNLGNLTKMQEEVKNITDELARLEFEARRAVTWWWSKSAARSK